MNILDKLLNKGNSLLKTPKPNSLLYNKILLYVIFVIAVFNFFSFVMSRDILHTVIFLIVGFITSFFSKNMLVILFMAIAITNILKFGKAIRVEGMETAKDEVVEEESLKKDKKESAETIKDSKSEIEKLDANKEKKEKVDKLKGKAEDLLSVQEKILKGFDEIAPYMDRAEGLIGEINDTAKTINGIQ